MNALRWISRCSVMLAALWLVILAVSAAQAPTQTTPSRGAVQPSGTTASKSYSPELIEKGGVIFARDCSFCHGRDAGGGESGPDLTRSKLVIQDLDGDKIGPVVRNGRPEKGMPPFNFSDEEIASLMAFIHTQQKNALTRKEGGRKGVDVADLQTGNVEAGKQYFNGAGGCATCHSPTGDLVGVASRYQGLALEKQMLYPEDAKSKVTVTRAGQTITGTLEYLDEFTIGLIDRTGVYRSWRTADVQYKVDAPVNAHVELFDKYTDTDIHNLMAYLQTLR